MAKSDDKPDKTIKKGRPYDTGAGEGTGAGLHLPTDEEVQRRAYRIWEREGQPHGKDSEHWEQARRELMSESGDPAPARPKREPKSGTAKAKKRSKDDAAE